MAQPSSNGDRPGCVVDKQKKNWVATIDNAHPQPAQPAEPVRVTTLGKVVERRRRYWNRTEKWNGR